MRKKLRRMMDTWGHYFLALLCAGVVLLSALWTRQENARADARAHSDLSQRLGAETQPPAAGLLWPAAGEILRGFSAEAVYFPAFSLWHSHSGVDFAAEAGESIVAMAEGTILSCGETVEIQQADGRCCRYSGLAECLVQPGQHVSAGERIGRAGAAVHFEGETGRICVMMLARQQPVDFSAELIDKSSK